MKAISLIQKSKKQKLNEEPDMDGNTKCLGNLPEVVLRHILSFLPPKDAVRTSLLSKRWEYLWTSIPNLRIEEEFFHITSQPFRNFVGRVLCLHDADLKEFSLISHLPCDASTVGLWVSAAVNKKVQVLKLRFYRLEGILSLPRSLFSCKTLVDLTLHFPSLGKLPHTIYFSNLKTLNIDSVTFSDKCSTQRLFSGLPVLEKLTLEHCSWCIKNFTIYSPNLSSLKIMDNNGRDSTCSGNCEVMIFGDNLKVFEFRGEFIEYVLHKALSLEQAQILYAPKLDRGSRHDAYRMYKLLIGVFNVKYLTLCYETVGALAEAGELLPHLPLFPNLIDLVFISPASLDLVWRMLQRCPCLETLKFLEGITCSPDFETDSGVPDQVPPCFASNLKYIEVRNYGGEDDKLSAIKILLKNAVVLNKMVVDYSGATAFREQLMGLPRGSKSCVLN